VREEKKAREEKKVREEKKLREEKKHADMESEFASILLAEELSAAEEKNGAVDNFAIRLQYMYRGYGGEEKKADEVKDDIEEKELSAALELSSQESIATKLESKKMTPELLQGILASRAIPHPVTWGACLTSHFGCKDCVFYNVTCKTCISHSARVKGASACAICMDEFKPSTHVSLLSCDHAFCAGCLLEFAGSDVCLSDFACPTCRQKL
jgi:hypothetical protein